MIASGGFTRPGPLDVVRVMPLVNQPPVLPFGFLDEPQRRVGGPLPTVAGLLPARPYFGHSSRLLWAGVAPVAAVAIAGFSVQLAAPAGTCWRGP